MEPTAPLMDVKRFAVHDGPGIRTTLFLKGCSLKCIWCHNPEGISLEPQMAYYQHKCIGCGECTRVCKTSAQIMVMGKEHLYERLKCVHCGACETVCLGEAMKLFGHRITVEEAMKTVLEDSIFYSASGGGVTVSGGEPLLHADFIQILFQELKKKNIHTAVDTCGNVPWAYFEMVLPFVDLFLYDIKHIDTKVHKTLTGAGNELILDNLKRLSASANHIEIRMPFVPGCNDDDDTIHRIGELLKTLFIDRMKLLPYHSMARTKYQALGMEDTMPRVESPTDEMLSRAINILKSYGINAISGRD